MNKISSISTIVFLLITILLPLESFGVLDTTISITIHSRYNIGGEMNVQGKLIDSENRSLSFVEVQVFESNDLLFIDDSVFLGKGMTDARGEFHIPIKVEDWDKDKTGEIYVIFEGNENHAPSSSPIREITITNYTPAGQEFEYEEIKENEDQNADTIDLSGGCLIATATYGSELAPQVQQLREIRDTKLVKTEYGSAFLESFNTIYYSFSPVIADYERENPYFKEMIKIVITPMISSLSVLNNVELNSEESVLGYGISLIILNMGMYLGIPVLSVLIVRKRI